jgi:hypothetical protein
MAVRDVILIGTLVFAVGIAMFVLFFSTRTVMNQMLQIPAFNQSEPASQAIQGSIKVTSQMDYVVFGLFIGLVLGLIITSWYIAGNAIFMGVYFLVVIINVVVSVILTNVWESTTQASIFGATIASFPITNQLMSNMPIYMLVVGFIGVVVMFAKPAPTEGY